MSSLHLSPFGGTPYKAAEPALRPRAHAVFVAVCALAVTAAASHAEPVPFVEVAAASGLDFVHFNGMSGELYFSEAAGSGVGLLDCDNDGDLDVYLSQGSMLGAGKKLSDALFPPAAGMLLGGTPGDRLYRNDLEVTRDGDHRLKLRDVTAASGLRATAYGMGVAAGDFDNDGAVDLYVTNFGDDQLWRGKGDCTFTDVTGASRVGNKEWSVSATFVDYDRDGWLDLYVGNYVDFTLETHKPCYTTSSARDYCGPRSYNPVPDRLYRNLGRGADGRVTFRDVSALAGVAADFGGALGVIAADFDLDGWPDVYVANDQLPNQLWINRRRGEDGLVRFTNEAALAGVAVNMDGSPEASMGVDAADFDGDGDEDIFLTHLNRQTNTIYVNEGDGWFSDKDAAHRARRPERAVHLLRHRLGGLRQRRLGRPGDRQRRGAGDRRAGAGERSVPAPPAQPTVSQPRRRRRGRSALRGRYRPGGCRLRDFGGQPRCRFRGPRQ